MKKSVLSDLSEIFEGRIDADSILRLATELGSFVDAYEPWAPPPAEIIIRTRDKNGKILKRNGAKCFTFEYNGYTIFAGSTENDPNDNRVPVIRFREENLFTEEEDLLWTRELFASIPSALKFSYKKPKWICVIISSASIDTIFLLMEIVCRGFHRWANRPSIDFSKSFLGPISAPGDTRDSVMKVKCPKCGCTEITANKQGFGLGKALAGRLGSSRWRTCISMELG